MVYSNIPELGSALWGVHTGYYMRLSLIAIIAGCARLHITTIT